MSTGNPGPAVTNDVHPSGLTTQQAKRLLFVQKGMSVTALTDAAVMNVINSSAWSIQEVVIANATGTATSTKIALWTGANGTGTNIYAATLITATATTVEVIAASSLATTALQTGNTLYANLSTTAGTGTVDLYVFGYDLSSPGLSYNSAQ